MFEVDTGAAVLTDNDLQLVIPSVRACSNLHTLVNFTRATEHVHAKLRRVNWLCVVETEDEQGTVDNIEGVAVVGALVFAQDFTDDGRDLAVLGTENTQGSFCVILDWSLFSIVDNSLQI